MKLNFTDEYYELPASFKATKPKTLIFIQKHGDVFGTQVLTRGTLTKIVKGTVMAVEIGKFKLEQGHVFLGKPRCKEVVNAFVHEVKDGIAYIGAVTSEPVALEPMRGAK